MGSLDCEILLLSARPIEDFEVFLGKFKSLFPDQASFELIHARSSAEVPDLVAVNTVPHVVLCDPSDRGVPAVITGLRVLDEAVCILILSPETPPSAVQVMEWLDRGATGLLAERFEPAEVAESLQEALGKRLSVHVPRNARVPMRHKVRLQLASFEQALVSETLNIGLGGMFVRAVPQNIAPDHEIEFELRFSRNLSTVSSDREEDPMVLKMEAEEGTAAAMGSVHGTGTVVWVRARAVNGLPEGIGVQFKDLDPVGREIIRKFVATHRIRAFIPKS